MSRAKKKRTVKKTPKRTRSIEREEPKTVQTDEEWWEALLAKATPADRVLLKAARTALGSERQSNLDRHAKVWRQVISRYEFEEERAKVDTTVVIIWDERALDDFGPKTCPKCGHDLTRGAE